MNYSVRGTLLGFTHTQDFSSFAQGLKDHIPGLLSIDVAFRIRSNASHDQESCQSFVLARTWSRLKNILRRMDPLFQWMRIARLPLMSIEE